MNLIWRSSRQETGPKIGRTGEGTVEGIKIALIPLFIRSRIDGLHLFGRFRGRGELVDGESVHACATPIAAVAGKRVVTIEGLAAGGELHPLQRAFVEAGALQCGYCTPGMILAAHALLARKPAATRAEIVDALEGNLCRCGAHQRILAAVEKVAAAKGGAA